MNTAIPAIASPLREKKDDKSTTWHTHPDLRSMACELRNVTAGRIREFGTGP
jgi:hypothetical protein